ncbi:MAG: putative metalloprotease CJM1_0395 family protein [Myxococcota bacterium]
MVQLSDANAIEPVELGPSYAQLWEEARQSLLRDPIGASPGEDQAPGPRELSDEDQAVVDELRARDAEVRAHEAAHAAIGGGVPTFVYQRGPDGRQYAVGGEVVVKMGGGSTAQGTIDRMQRVRAAALAPGNPSAQDMAVAAEATQRAAAARMRMNKAQTAEAVRRSEPQIASGERRRAASAFEAQQRLAVREDHPHQIA